MLLVFWKENGAVLEHYKERKSTAINSARYCEMLTH